MPQAAPTAAQPLAPVLCARSVSLCPSPQPLVLGPEAVSVENPAFLGFPEEAAERAFCVRPRLVVSQTRGAAAQDGRIHTKRDQEQP